MSKQMKGYFQEIERSYKEQYAGKSILIISPRTIIDKALAGIKKQLKTVLKENIKIDFLTDFSFKGDSNKLEGIRNLSSDISIKQVPFNRGSLLEDSFEYAEINGISKLIILTNKKISGIMFGEKIDLNYINDVIFRKLTLDPKLESQIKKILEYIENSNVVDRVHFVNITTKNTLFKELFTLYGGGDGYGILVSKDYQMELDKLTKSSEGALFYLHALLKELSVDGYVNYKNLDYIVKNIANYFTLNIDGYPIGMFEVKPISEFTKEVGTVIIDFHFQGGGIGYRVMDEIMGLRNSVQYKYYKFIIVTGNIFLKNILNKFNNTKEVQSEDDLYGDPKLEKRYQKMLKNNEEDGNNRSMYSY